MKVIHRNDLSDSSVRDRRRSAGRTPSPFTRDAAYAAGERSAFVACKGRRGLGRVCPTTEKPKTHPADSGRLHRSGVRGLAGHRFAGRPHSLRRNDVVRRLGQSCVTASQPQTATEGPMGPSVIVNTLLVAVVCIHVHRS